MVLETILQTKETWNRQNTRRNGCQHSSILALSSISLPIPFLISPPQGDSTNLWNGDKKGKSERAKRENCSSNYLKVKSEYRTVFLSTVAAGTFI